jgi:hypothetical protein
VILNNDEFSKQRISTMQRQLETNKTDLKSSGSRFSFKGNLDSGYCFLEMLLESKKRLIGVAIFNVPFLICCNSTTNPIIETRIIELERS